MPVSAFFVIPGSFTLSDDGVVGNNISTVRTANGSSIFPFVHPADSVTFEASAVVVDLAVDFSDLLGTAALTLGDLLAPGDSFENLFMDRVNTTGTVTLVANAAITEVGSDAGADVIAGALVASAGTGIGTALNALETQTSVIEAKTTTGGININNVGAVVIGGSSDQVNGLQVLTSGDIRLVNLGSIFLGDFDLDAGNPPGGPLQTITGGSVSGDVLLTANGVESDIVSLVDNDSITASRGSIVLTSGRDVSFGTGGADFDNDVRANGSITVNAGRDFIIDGFADLSSDNFGENTGGNVVINAGRHIQILDVTGTDASVLAAGSAGADVLLTAGAGGFLILNAPTTFAVQSMSGDVIVSVDSVLIASDSGITAGAGQVILRPTTAGRAIELGTLADPAGIFALSDAELDRIFTPSLTIGSTTSGSMTVTNAISPASATALSLVSGETISLLGDVTVAGALAIRAGDDVLLDDVAIVAASIAIFVDQAGDDGGTGGIADLSQLNIDTVTSVSGNAEADTLIGHLGRDTLLGHAGTDTLVGNDGNDTLDGGANADSMNGGAGDDVYRVDNSSDTLVEAIGQGFDRVFSTISYTLAAGVSVELLATSNAAATTAINFVGNELNQRLSGNNGVNVLNGGGGNDFLEGFGGNDIYFVDGTPDTIVEIAGGGTLDRVLASTTFSLQAGVDIEFLGTTDQTSTNLLNLVGNGVAQTIVGNAGINTLKGNGGADTLRGLGGNDFYHVDSNDLIEETAGGGTLDRALASSTFALAADDDIEYLATDDEAGLAAINLLGNGLAQSLVGNAGANILVGFGGRDVLRGLGGTDTFSFRNLSDSGTSVATRDVVEDFDDIAGAAGDRFDVSLIDAIPGGANDAFSFRANNGDAFTDAGQLRWFTSGGNTFVEVNVNADFAADFSFMITGIRTLDAGDFVL